MNIFFSVFMSVLLAPLFGELVHADAKADAPEWQLVWSDEFTGYQIDREKWQFDIDCWGGGNNEKQCYTALPENASVSGGFLKITAHHKTSTGYALPLHLRKGEDEMRELPFSSARLVTRGKAAWRYGRFEIRAKLPEGQGTWPAIWMLPRKNRYGSWAASGEIDIMEAVNLGARCDECSGGKENRILGTLHYGAEWPENTHKGSDITLPISPDGFHIFAVEWKQGEISWFVDGQKYSSLTSEDWFSAGGKAKGSVYAPFDQPFYLILNLAVGGKLAEERNEKGVDVEDFPKSMLVDWVRIYQRTKH
ncbi:glycoside hydrolase family 16 protein [Kordiimonas sp. SCSIO 12603]|uniref:glycoside hydrolase family 16 protein n=1 Tax=Kordiimonas sp. SCSIO 12603 TaxID=2829596 RepID=UPI002107AD1E|nr:glycoside hydrolase family 16 protein [Kordiimonas sp. SCSIO 12603]UTW58746.1 glycoside hydrolase family 16 protein [Kordiimonas sp. SCSIO 12603]